jgi:hypothetical protein
MASSQQPIAIVSCPAYPHLQCLLTYPIQVGIAAELPSGEATVENFDHKQFFEFLLNKGEAYERIPLERFNIDSSVTRFFVSP